MLQERTLTSDEVWDACSTRLKQYYARTLDTETVGTFTRSSPATVVRWLENQSTNGDRLIRLWYFLEAAGFSSPEIDDLNTYNRYVGQLFAFDVIDMPEVLKIINVKQESSAFEFMRGRTPMHPTLLLEDLEPRYGNELAGARRMLRAILQNIPSAPAAPTALAAAALAAAGVTEPASSQPAVAPATSSSADGSADVAFAIEVAQAIQNSLVLLRLLGTEQQSPATRKLVFEIAGDLDELPKLIESARLP